jgi:hypothetical protein
MKNWVQLTNMCSQSPTNIDYGGASWTRTSPNFSRFSLAAYCHHSPQIFDIGFIQEKLQHVTVGDQSILLDSSIVKTINFVHDAGQINQPCRRIHHWVSICNNAACNKPLSNTATRARFASELRALIRPR